MALTPRKIFGWKPDIPDRRDYAYKAKKVSIPTSVDLRTQTPPVLDQGDLGSCTSQAISNAYLFEETKQKIVGQFLPSRLFVYYNERVLEGTVKYDSGAEIRTGFKTIGSQGVCPETEWPYVISKFRTRPPTATYTHAVKHKVLQYSRLNQTLTDMKNCLANGYPFVFGFAVYSSFLSSAVSKTGVVPSPGKRETMLGGHAVLCVGYSDAQSRFICQNSWGTSWGDKGYFIIPYSYLTNSNLAADFWTIRLV